MPVIEVKNLVKEYPLPGKAKGTFRAVDDVSFVVEKGEIFGLLGPNGAGKTTTLEIIEGLNKPTSGHTTVLGFDSHKDTNKVKYRIGIELQASSYYNELHLDETLKLFGTFYKKKVNADELLHIVDLTEKKKALVKELSGGQQHRFSIAAALVNDPDVVFLDEPTTGLDPQARRHLWQFIRKINTEGKTIILTTHYMDEAQELCNRVGVIDHGKIIALDTPRNLINNLESTARLTFRLDTAIDPEEFKSIAGVLEATKPNEHYELHISHASIVIPPLMQWSESKGMRLHELEVHRASLEDVFLSLTGSELRD
ncbi:MAG: ABC transporter ATP-binding protein [Patescibacteria group bacterium]|jgi:ABC-2 type transport system ATP-binding protein